jgi:P2 family phage contractile tail tube protein
MREGIAKLNNVFKVYDSESGKPLDGTVTVELPTFALATETFKGAGLAGEVNVPVPGVMSALTVTISCPKIYGAITKYLELGTTKTLDLRNEIIVTNTQNHSQEKVPDRWVLKGPLSEASPGSAEQASASDASIVMQVYYAHHWMDGDDILEWDVLKYIFTVNGKDLMADTRKNLGIG